MAQHCSDELGSFHAAHAARLAHWYDLSRGAWLAASDAERGQWSGWSASSGSPVALAPSGDWWPQSAALDESAAPLYRWQAGARTNAAFNELDRHVLAAHGERTVIVDDGAEWRQVGEGSAWRPARSSRPG